jgi:hypothetical protein
MYEVVENDCVSSKHEVDLDGGLIDLVLVFPVLSFVAEQ